MIYVKVGIGLFGGLLLSYSVLLTCAGAEGGMGSRTPPALKNHKNIRYPNNTGPDPLKNHKDAKPAFNDGPSSARQRNDN